MVLTLAKMFGGGPKGVEQAAQLREAIREEVKAELANAPAPAPAAASASVAARSTMPEEQRLALADEVRELRARSLRRRELVASMLAEAEERARLAREEVDRICGDQGEEAANTMRFDELMRLLAANAPPEVAVLAARCRQEADALVPDHVTLLEGSATQAGLNDVREYELFDHARYVRSRMVVENVIPRQRALRELADLVEHSAATAAHWRTRDDLRVWFATAYAALPAVEPLVDVLARDDDPRARAARARLVRRSGPRAVSTPPIAG